MRVFRDSGSELLYPGTSARVFSPRDFIEAFQSDAPVMVIEPSNWRICMINPPLLSLLEFNRREIEDGLLRRVLAPTDADSFSRQLEAALYQEGTQLLVPLRRQDGSTFHTVADVRRLILNRHVYLKLQLVEPGQISPLFRALFVRDAALNACVNGVTIVDITQASQPLIFVNPAFERLSGYSAEEVLGRNCRFLQGSDDQPQERRAIREAINEHREVRVLLRNYKKDGTLFHNELFLAPVRDTHGQVSHFVGIQNDVSWRFKS